MAKVSAEKAVSFGGVAPTAELGQHWEISLRANAALLHQQIKASKPAMEFVQFVSD
jgi:hypothetical protein